LNDNVYKVSKRVVHPEYNESNLNNDLALFKLDKPVPLNERIQVICLPTSDDYETIFNKSVTIVGW
jgi:secreted trypsin-like serine protease